jgi:hypothetical protein
MYGAAGVNASLAHDPLRLAQQASMPALLTILCA